MQTNKINVKKMTSRRIDALSWKQEAFEIPQEKKWKAESIAKDELCVDLFVFRQIKQFQSPAAVCSGCIQAILLV